MGGRRIPCWQRGGPHRPTPAAFPGCESEVSFLNGGFLGAPMTGRFCPHCGRPALSTASFCSSCGGALAAPPSSGPLPGVNNPPAFVPGGGYAPYGTGYLGTNRAMPSTREGDLSAMSSVLLATVFGLIGAILSVIELVGSPAFSLFSVSTSGTSSTVTGSATSVYAVAALSAAGIVVAMLMLWNYRRAFASLATYDSQFSTPATLTLLAIIAIGVLFLVLFGLLALVFQAITCSGIGMPLKTGCINVGALIGLAVLLFAVAIVALIGYIGFLIGVWRLGTRFDNGLFKVGAVLLIFPVLNIVGLVLLLVAARATRARISGGSFGYGFT